MIPKELIDHLKNHEILKSSNIERALKVVDRKDFLPTDYTNDPYVNNPINIGFGQTNSQPLTVVFMLELLEVSAGQKVLDIGSGSGWTTALLAFLIGESGAVTGIERIADLVTFGQKNLQKYAFKHASIESANENEFGIPGKKFDRILVSAAYYELPQGLVDQLEDNGILVIPINHSLFKVTKNAGKIEQEEFRGFTFVPLVV
ncbi:MAG: protein-L-isoaspartate O-methyltransferase [Alphaproteobacteria bacterium]|nr:protein-L-isoaspartate O-methyltransferase [Alphaproteobacteria bacterium]